MATRDQPGVEYIDIETKKGTVETLSMRLYAPDGSIFTMPHGGTVLTYTAKDPPFKLKPDDVWYAAHEEREAINAASLKVSNFQREIKNREEALKAKQILADQMIEMERQISEMDAAEAALDNPSETVEVAPETTTVAGIELTPVDGLGALTKKQLVEHITANKLTIKGLGPMNKPDTIAAIRAQKVIV